MTNLKTGWNNQLIEDRQEGGGGGHDSENEDSWWYFSNSRWQSNGTNGNSSSNVQAVASCSSSSSSRRCLNGINFVQNKSIMVGHAKRGETGDDLSHLFCDKRAVSNPGFSSLHT